MVKKSVLRDVDLKGYELFYSYIDEIETEKQVIISTIQILDIFKKDRIVFSDDTIKNLEIAFFRQIQQASARWKNHLETAQIHIDSILEKNSSCATVSKLAAILRERLAEIALPDINYLKKDNPSFL